ncbi:hypothetical protein A2U01_0104671 [Trifolium medium]|uniref:Uncharacterized protein n=1 Tax=Trifolium medium TaxID=97028 RepID=A0A392V968_9FABA|nr:hypothetical protein [Trifolium medium]
MLFATLDQRIANPLWNHLVKAGTEGMVTGHESPVDRRAHSPTTPAQQITRGNPG